MEKEIEKAERENPALVEILEFYFQWKKKYPIYEISFEIGKCGNAEIEALAVIMESDELPEAKRGELNYLRVDLRKGDSIEVNKFKTK